MQTEPKRAGGAIPRLFFCLRRHTSSAVLAALLIALLIPALTRAGDVSAIRAGAKIGRASWYGAAFRHRQTASGRRFDPADLTCAHRTLPLGTTVRVTNLHNGRSVLVTITDRGPYRRHRDIDVSYGAARVLGMVQRGLARVLIEPLS